MTQATLSFNLDDEDGERRMRECIDAPRVIAAVQEFDQWLRNQIKYYDDPVEHIRSQLNHIFEQRGVSVWE